MRKTTSSEPWWTAVNARDGLEVAEALGLTPAWGRGRASRWCLPHNDCEGKQGDGEPSVFYGSEARKLCCRKCSKSLGNLDVISAFLGIREAVCDAVQLEASAHGWCEAPARVDHEALERKRAESRKRQAQLVEERAQREAQRQATAIDVSQAWGGLLQAHSRSLIIEDVRRWAVDARGWPVALARGLDQVEALVLPERPHCIGHAEALAALALHWRRRLIIPIRNAFGGVVSASCRWHMPGSPTDGGPKAMTLPAERILTGALTGKVHCFGDLDFALDFAARGEPLVIGEGGPDWLAAAALCRLRGQAQAVAACSAQLMPALAQHVRAQLRVRIGDSGRRPRIILAPHRDDAGEAGAQAAAAILAQVGEVRVATWPDGCGDLADVARAHPLALAQHLIFGGR